MTNRGRRTAQQQSRLTPEHGIFQTPTGHIATVDTERGPRARDMVESSDANMRTVSNSLDRRDRLAGFFRPSSVAIVGASPQRGSPRNTIIRVLQKHDFRGRIYPVSPRHAEVEGLRAHPLLADLPETPDIALVITPAETVPGIIAECGAKGIQSAIVFSSGFEETEGGKAHARRLAAAARQHDVTVLGPNCQGIWSVRQKTMLSFGGALMNLDVLHHAPIAIISQSGALAGAIGNSLQGSGIGCSYIVSVGNETCLDALDVLEWIIEQEDVRVAALYVEGLHDAARILPIAQRGRELGVQIVVLKAGRSELGQQATASHTGKIASTHTVYSDVLEQAGVITVDSISEMVMAAEVFAFLPNPRLSSDEKAGVTVLSASGGAGALLADYSSELGIPMAEFSADTAARLDGLLPEFARKANPIDLTAQINTDPALFRNACEAVGADPRTEAVIVQFAGSGRRQIEENAAAYVALAEQVPVLIGFAGETPTPEARQSFRGRGVFLCADPFISMSALSLLYKRQRMQALPSPTRRGPLPTRPTPRTWSEIMAFCDEAGVTSARHVVLRPQDRAASACAELNYPLVVKVLPSDASHKTELGLVKLGVQSAEYVDALADELRERLGNSQADVLVQEMIDEGVEVVLSCRRQTDFGPVLSIGTGGIAIELYRDITHMALPVSVDQVLTALRKLKLWTLLQGFRGRPAADVEALVQAAVGLGGMFLATPGLSELEINPIIVGRAGVGLRAVDALVGMAP